MVLTAQPCLCHPLTKGHGHKVVNFESAWKVTWKCLCKGTNLPKYWDCTSYNYVKWFTMFSDKTESSSQTWSSDRRTVRTNITTGKVLKKSTSLKGSNIAVNFPEFKAVRLFSLKEKRQTGWHTDSQRESNPFVSAWLCMWHNKKWLRWGQLWFFFT